MTALKPSAASDRPAGAPTLVWLRKDLRLADNHALSAAAQAGPVIPVFILDDVFETTLGAAAKLRLKLSLEALSADFARMGAHLILRRGDALSVLRDLIAETGAKAVTWTRLTDGAALERDKKVKAALTQDGVRAESFGGFTLLDPWTVKTGAGGQFKVYTPFWRAVSARDIERPLRRPASILYHIIRYCLLRYRTALEGYGLREQHMEWLPTEPAPEYLQAGHFIYQRPCMFSCVKDEDFPVEVDRYKEFAAGVTTTTGSGQPDQSGVDKTIIPCQDESTVPIPVHPSNYVPEE